ncbi:MAG: hypothetical protein LBD92_04870 [Oscillospiraceae bacterium]|nr:hypothetical protein [Oscillospiraceae bacterium]
MEVSVSLGIPADNFICTYPRYDDGWEVTARPDGTLVNKADGEEYSYLFWEAKMEVAWDMPDGFLVKGADSEEFFREKLRFLGLLPKEYNEFIVYWLPRLQKNEYNLIRFAGAEYENAVPLEISPPPDSILRVFMIFRKAKSDEVIPQQELTAFERRGFAAVEWGGAEIGASGADYVFEG